MGDEQVGRRRRRRGERGTGLVEVVLVVTVLGALPAAGFGWLSVAGDRAADRAAEVDLRTAVLAVAVARTEAGVVDRVGAGRLAEIEPGLGFVEREAGPGEVEVRPGDDGTGLVVRSTSGRCFAVRVATDGAVERDPATPGCEPSAGLLEEALDLDDHAGDLPGGDEATLVLR